MGTRRLSISLAVLVAVAASLTLFAGTAHSSFIRDDGGCIGIDPLPTFNVTGTGPVGTQVTLDEGAWTDSCGASISTVTYDFYRDDTTHLDKESHWSVPSGGTQAYYNTQSADAGHVVFAQATACDSDSNCATFQPTGTFVVTPATGPSGAKVGLNSDPYDPDQTGSVCASGAMPYDSAANSQWARVFVRWNQYEPSSGTYDPDYVANLSSCIQALHDAGESVLADFDSSPAWATGTNLTSDTDTTQTAINVGSASAFPSSGSYTIRIDNEQMTVTAGQGTTTWTVTRGVNGTTPAAHSSGANVALVPAITEPPNNPTTCPAEACYGAAAVNLVTDPSIVSAGGIQAVEVWNEENDQNNYWSGTRSDYETLLQTAYQQLNALSNPPQVVLGGTSKVDYDWDHRIMDDENTNSSLQCSLGPLSKFCFDVVGVHTYALSNQKGMVGGQSAGNTSTSLSNSPDIPAILNGDTTTDLDNESCTTTTHYTTVNVSGGLSTTTTSFAVASASGFPSAPFTIVVDHEHMRVTAVNSNTFTVTRHYDGTNAATHANGTLVAALACGRLTNIINDLNHYGLTSTYIWITEMGAEAGPGQWLGDQQNANMLTNFYDYIRGLTVPSNFGTPTCPNTCQRITFGIWFSDFLDYTGTSAGDYSMLYNGDPNDHPEDYPGTDYLVPKPVMTALINLHN